MADPGRDTSSSGPDSPRFAVADHEPGVIETSDLTFAALPEWDWPPVSYAENDHILVWWLPDYDEMLHRLVDEYQWAWRSQVLTELESRVPETVLCGWREVDPQCREYSWDNVLDLFAAARAKQLGIRPREPHLVVCSCCSREFLESHLAYHFIVRLGVNGIDVCDKCLSEALYPSGSQTSTPDAVTAVLQTLSRALRRPPKGIDLYGRVELKGLSRDARAAVVQALRVKPAVSRVKELFGSWDAAVAHAEAAPATSLPPYELSAPVLTDTEFTSSGPARYRALIGPLPEVTVDASREPWTYGEEVQSLIGTGYLALAEAALTQLTRPPEPGLLISQLAQLYGQTARFDEARAVTVTTYGEQNSSSGHLIQSRDFRTITSGPAFYEPLASLPRGNVRFVLVGGPMEFADRRGEHRCTTGEAPDGGAEAKFAESVARMSAMMDGAAWMRAATETGQAIMASFTRAGADPRPFGHLVSYVTGPFRDVVKAVAGALPSRSLMRRNAAISDGSNGVDGPGRVFWSRTVRQSTSTTRALERELPAGRGRGHRDAPEPHRCVPVEWSSCSLLHMRRRWRMVEKASARCSG
jgi:hypothetical protein